MKQRVLEFLSDGYGKLTHKLARRRFTRMLVARYCKGNGIEIGPGSVPYGKATNTIYLDKFEQFQHKPFKLDVHRQPLLSVVTYRANHSSKHAPGIHFAA